MTPKTLESLPNLRQGDRRTATDRRAPIRLVGDERTQVASDLAAVYLADRSASIRAIEKVTGLSFGLIYRLLGEAGVHLRGGGGNTKRRKVAT